MTSVRFAHTALDNIGASISLSGDVPSEGEDDHRLGSFGAPLNEIVDDPLSIGVEENIRGMKCSTPLNADSNLY